MSQICSNYMATGQKPRLIGWSPYRKHQENRKNQGSKRAPFWNYTRVPYQKKLFEALKQKKTHSVETQLLEDAMFDINLNLGEVKKPKGRVEPECFCRLRLAGLLCKIPLGFAWLNGYTMVYHGLTTVYQGLTMGYISDQVSVLTLVCLV